MLIYCTDDIHKLKPQIKEQLEKEGSPFHRMKLNTLTAGYGTSWRFIYTLTIG